MYFRVTNDEVKATSTTLSIAISLLLAAVAATGLRWTLRGPIAPLDCELHPIVSLLERLHALSAS